MSWIEFKDYISQATSLDQDALHIYAAVLIQLGAALLTRRSLASVVPWLVVWAAIIVNEGLDLWLPGERIQQWQVVGGVQDSWNTMAIPTVLWLLAHYAPQVLTGPARQPAADPAPSSAL
ncbi:MAG TPA: hypothetical protein VGX37_03945 [Allosphingosinicella sp.]|jgi:hypothetical protein|nr:hypothetical protein [Allosphingosinicella sp.]